MVSNLQMQIEGTLRDKVPVAVLGTLSCMYVCMQTQKYMYMYIYFSLFLENGQLG